MTTPPTKPESETPEQFFNSLMKLDYDEINKIKLRDEAMRTEGRESLMCDIAAFCQVTFGRNSEVFNGIQQAMDKRKEGGK